jgi:trehalose-6-phosphate synthase
VLSSAAGSNDILQDGVVTIRDPRDVAETADALECALDMPIAERRRRARLLAARIAVRDPIAWLTEQLQDSRHRLHRAVTSRTWRSFLMLLACP